MSHLSTVTDFVGSYPQFAFIVILLLALSEAMPVIGTMVPGSTLILAISAIATAANVNPWLLLVAAVLGAIAGDGLSFWMGYRYRRQILRGWPLNRFPGLILRSARFIRRHGVVSVFLARFLAVVRAFVPLVAGIMRMPSRRFYAANVLSAVVWAPMHVYPGVLAGMALSVAGPHGTRLGLLALVILVLASIAWHLFRGGASRLESSPSANPDEAVTPNSRLTLTASQQRGPYPRVPSETTRTKVRRTHRSFWSRDSFGVAPKPLGSMTTVGPSRDRTS